MTWSYQAALDYLYSFINYEVRREVRYAPEVMNLDRPIALLAGLGAPHRQYPIIHIAGTKGKGSVGAFCQATLQAAGLRTGLYSSPHLQEFRERFRIDNAMITPEMLTELLAEIKPVADGIAGLTWFELTTALGFHYFARQNVDAVVCEVGLGGRLDATNVVHPLVSVITSLSYDHTYLLGNTLAEIAREKAGIIKPGVPVVSAPQPPEAAAVLEHIATERNAPLIVVGRDWVCESGQTTRCGQSFRAGPAAGPLRDYWTPLIGEHQVINATVALAALDVTRRYGVNLPADAAVAGLRAVNWPGRFEIVRQQPWVILDAAHNGESAQRLSQALEALFADVNRRMMIFGAMTDKDVHSMFTILLPHFDHLIVTQAAHPRARTVSELAALAHEVGYAGTVEEVPAMEDAIARAQQDLPAESLILITGSVALVGEARDVFGLTPGRAIYCDMATAQQVQTQ
jgi:dihydrofolate synthase/folylpolyglutamate synthase